MNIKLLKLYKNKIFLLFFGFICCSTFSTYISFKLGLPFGVPEIFALIFFPFFHKEFIYFKKVFLNNFFEIFLIFFILLGLGLIVNNIYALKVLASSRAYLYLIIFFFFGHSKFNLDLNKLFYIGIGSIIGGYLNGLLLGDTQGEVRAYSNLVSFAIIVSYPLIKKRYFIFIFFLLGALYVGFYSGLRRQIAEILLNLVFTYFLIIIKDGKSFKSLFTKLILLPILLYNLVGFFVVKIENYFLMNNIYLYNRIFQKTYRIENSNQAESSRISHFANLSDYIYDTVIPKGIYPRLVGFSVNNSGGSPLDFPLYEIFYTLGSLTTIVLILFFFKTFFINIGSLFTSNKNKDEIIMISSISILLFCASFFDGSFLQYTFVTPFTGFVLGRFFFLKRNLKT